MTADAISPGAAAYDEAGHAVVARMMGYRVDGISVMADGTSGETRYTGPASDKGTPVGRMRELTITLAGKAAQSIAFNREDIGDLDQLLETVRDLRRWSPNAPDPDLECGLEHDDMKAAVLVWDLPEDEREKELRNAHASVREILGANWADVVAVATRIEARRRESMAVGDPDQQGGE